MSVLRRVTGMGSAGSLALALLAGGCVLAATVGPRQAQATGARALQQTMAGLTQIDKTIVVSSSLGPDHQRHPGERVYQGSVTGLPEQNLTKADDADVTTQLRRDFSTGPLPLTPPSTDWLGMNPGLFSVATPLPSLKGIPAQAGAYLPVPDGRQPAAGGRQHARYRPAADVYQHPGDFQHPGRGHPADGQGIRAAARLPN